MVDYTKWVPTNEYPVTDLQLDKFNPRIPEELIEEASQEDIRTLMVERYNIYPLAESIAKNGFEPRELMIVVFENERPIVVEGNRRLTALKLLINPEIAPLRERQKYQVLHSQIELSAIMNPNVIVAPSREDADPIIVNKHTTNTEIPWKPLMQSFFYERKVKEYSSLTLNEVADKLKIGRDQIDSALLRLNLYNRLVPLVSMEVKQYVENQEKFDITTLERFTKNPSIRRMLKVTIQENVFIPEDSGYFDFMIKCLAEWMFKGPRGKLERITSRTANTADQMKKYILEARSLYKTIANHESSSSEDAPDENQKPVPNHPNPISPSTAESEVKNSGEKDEGTLQPTRKRFVKKMLVEENQFSYTVKGIPNSKLLKELQNIQIDKTPNISVIVLRVFLERIIRQFIVNNNVKSIEVPDQTKRNGISKKKLWNAEFGEIIDYITTRECTLIDDEDVKKGLKAFKGRDASTSVALCNLNNIVHYHGKIYTKSEVYELRDSLATIIEYFTTNPETETVFAPKDDDNTEIEIEVMAMDTDSVQ